MRRPDLRVGVLLALVLAGILGGCRFRPATTLYDCEEQPLAGGMSPDGTLYDAKLCAGGAVILTPNGRKAGSAVVPEA